jgi:hypothetical protein
LARSENINFFGAIDVDIEGELAQLGPTGYRPLRSGSDCCVSLVAPNRIASCSALSRSSSEVEVQLLRALVRWPGRWPVIVDPHCPEVERVAL